MDGGRCLHRGRPSCRPGIRCVLALPTARRDLSIALPLTRYPRPYRDLTGFTGKLGSAGSRWAQYQRWTHEYVLGAVDLATGLKRPRLRDGVTRIALKQAIRDIVLVDPAFQCPTPTTVVRHGGGLPLDSVVMAA